MNIYPADVVDTHDDRTELQGMALYLQTRFFPALDTKLAPAALAALRLLNGGDDTTEIILPAELQTVPRLATPWANGSHLIAPANLVDVLRLWDHVSNPDDESDADVERVDNLLANVDDREV